MAFMAPAVGGVLAVDGGSRRRVRGGARRRRPTARGLTDLVQALQVLAVVRGVRTVAGLDAVAAAHPPRTAGGLVGGRGRRDGERRRDGDHHRAGGAREAQPLQPRNTLRRSAVQRDGHHRRHPVARHPGHRRPPAPRQARRPRVRLGDAVRRRARPRRSGGRLPDDTAGARPAAWGLQGGGRPQCGRTGRRPLDAADRLVDHRRRSAGTALLRHARAAVASAGAHGAGGPGAASAATAGRAGTSAADPGRRGRLRRRLRPAHLAGAARAVTDPPGRGDVDGGGADPRRRRGWRVRGTADREPRAGSNEPSREEVDPTEPSGTSEASPTSEPSTGSEPSSASEPSGASDTKEPVA